MENKEQISGEFPQVENESEGLAGLPMAIDVPPEEMERVNGLPLRAQQIGALLASGFSPPDIDRAFSLSEGTARAYRTKYFANKSLDISPRTRDLILASYFRNKSVEMVSHITPDKLAAAGVGELSKSSALLMQRARDLEGTSQSVDIGAQISNALSKLSQRVERKQVA